MGVAMKKLEKELERLVDTTEDGSGETDYAKRHQRRIDLLKFKITRRDNFRIAAFSALIGALVGAGVTVLGKVL